MIWTWWMTLLVIGAVLLLIGITPVGGDIRYDGDSLRVFLKVWCFRVCLLPAKEKKKKTEQKKKPQKKPEEQKPASRKHSVSLDDMMGLLQLACNTLGDLRRKIRVDLFSLHLTFGGEDPANAAIAYGASWALIGAMDPMLSQLFVIKKRDIQPILDYTVEKTNITGQMILSLTIGRALALVLRAGIRFVKLRAANKEKAV